MVRCPQRRVSAHAPVTLTLALRITSQRRRCHLSPTTSACKLGLWGLRMAILAVCSLLIWDMGSSSSGAAASSPANRVLSLGHAAVTSARCVDLTASRWAASGVDDANYSSSRCTTGVAQGVCAGAAGSTVNKRTKISSRGGGKIVKNVEGTRTGESATTTNSPARLSTRNQGNEPRQHASHPPWPQLSAWIQLYRKNASEGASVVQGAKQQQPCQRGSVLWQLQNCGTTIARRAAALSKAEEEQQQQLPPTKQLGGYLSTTTAAMVKTLARGPSALRSGAAAAAASAIAACTKLPPQSDASSARGNEALPPKSYLLWPAAQTCDGSEADGVASGKEGNLRRRQEEQMSRGKGGDRTRQGESGGEEAESKRQGSLGTAKESRGGAAAAAAGKASLTFSQAMVAGAVSRSIAQTCMQPANVVKTLLQGRGTSEQLSKLSFSLLTRGAGAQFVLSLPHGAFNYATLEVILGCTNKIFPEEWRGKAGPALDFFSSSVATLVCSVVSTPQMVLTDRIMAGMYPNLVSGIREITRTEGLKGFYTGWSANVAQKIPSYGLTWVFFQQFKRLHRRVTDRAPTNTENFVLGAAAAGATVCIMIPMDTVKTRIVTQTVDAGVAPYRGVLGTLARVVKEEGVGSIYRALTPRLVSVVPMIGIQFGIYEFIRNEFITRQERDMPEPWLHEGVRRTLGLGKVGGTRQHDYVKDFLHNVILMEEELV